MSHKLFGDSLPFVLGVSGHLDLAASDIPLIYSKLVERFKKYQRRLGQKITPFLASGLARGADQLAARAALEAGWGLIAVLPMPAEEFLASEDFLNHPNAAREFSELLAIANSHVITLDANITLLDDDIYCKNDQLFRNQSNFLAVNCSAVLVLWDGVVAGKGACGTSYVVKVCKGDVLSQQLVWGDKVSKHLDHIKVRRSDSAPAIEPISSTLPKAIDFFIAEICELTQSKAWVTDSQIIEQSKYSLLDVDEQVRANSTQLCMSRWNALDEGSKTLLQAFVRMDCLSSHFQSRRHVVIRLATLLATFGGVLQCLGSISHIKTLQAVSWSLILIAAGLAFWCFNDQYLRYHSKYIDLRLLAESLRIQFYWRMAGIKQDIFEQFDNRSALSEVDLLSFLSGIKVYVSSGKNYSLPNPEMVNHCWVAGQKQYFEKKYVYYHKQQLQTQIIKYLLFFLAAFSYLFSQFGSYFTFFQYVPKDLGQSLTTLSFFLLALLSNYSDVMHFDSLLRAYEAQLKVFNAGKKLISSKWSDDATRFTQVGYVRRLGLLAMQETTDWLRNQREKKFDYKKLTVH